MKFDRYLYDNYSIPEHNSYLNYFTFPKDIETIVTFQDNKKFPIYSWFPYKQGFSHLLVKRIIKNEINVNDPIIYDPFLGSGTTALATIEMGYKANGSEQLPLCVFITKAKIAALRLEPNSILSAANDIISMKKKWNIKWPDIIMVKKAIPQEIQDTLMDYRLSIENSNYSDDLKDTLLLALVSSVEKCSYIKKDGGFPRIVLDKKIEGVKDVFLRNCTKFKDDLIEYHKNELCNASNIFDYSNIKVSDARQVVIENESVDYVITSPPYLNKTDYTRVYALEMCLLFITEFSQIRDLRYKSFCGHVEAKPVMPRHNLPASIMSKVNELTTAKLTNPRHPVMAEGYFQDLYYCLLDNYRYTKPNAGAAWVVWNSRLSGIHFPVDVLLAELAESVGFRVDKIECIRLTGTSAQQAKLYGDKPLRESIIYLRK